MEQIKPTPIFIFSLPRSGSTLLQKIIASSDEVDTASEPWLLLPILYTQKEKGLVAEYSHEHALVALHAVREAIREKGSDYDHLVRAFAESLYSALSKKGSKYFLDKTPRYYLIINEILRTFPNAKFIFLFRNPLSQLSSHLRIHGGRIRTMYFNAIDILFGHTLLAEGYRLAHDRALKFTYSQLVSETDSVRKELNDFLGLDIQAEVLSNLKSVELKGKLGDPGLMANKKQSVNTKSLVKWKSDVTSLVRKVLVKKYLQNIDDSYFECLGQSRDEFLQQLSAIRIYRVVSIRDACDMIYCWLNAKFKLALNFAPRYRWTRYKRLG